MLLNFKFLELHYGYYCIVYEIVNVIGFVQNNGKYCGSEMQKI